MCFNFFPSKWQKIHRNNCRRKKKNEIIKYDQVLMETNRDQVIKMIKPVKISLYGQERWYRVLRKIFYNPRLQILQLEADNTVMLMLLLLMRILNEQNSLMSSVNQVLSFIYHFLLINWLNWHCSPLRISIIKPYHIYRMDDKLPQKEIITCWLKYRQPDWTSFVLIGRSGKWLIHKFTRLKLVKYIIHTQIWLLLWS